MIDITVIAYLNWHLRKHLSKTGRFIKYYDIPGYKCNEFFLEESKIIVKQPSRYNQDRNEDRINLQCSHPTIQTQEQLIKIFNSMSNQFGMPLSDMVDSSLFLPMNLPDKALIRKNRYQLLNKFCNTTKRSIYRIFS